MKSAPRRPSAKRQQDKAAKPRHKTADKGTKRPFKPTAKPSAPQPRPEMRPAFTDKRRDSVFLWGLHAVREAWQNPARTCYRLWATDSAAAALEKAMTVAREAGLARPNIKITNRADIDEILPPDVVHQGIALEAAPIEPMLLEDFLDQDPLPGCLVVLDQVTDPHNVGAILRSAAAFGAGAVIVTERHAPATTGTLAKTACGAADHVPLIPIVNMARALDLLQKAGYWCVGLAEEGETDLAAQNLTEGKTALVLGAEGEGLRRLTREHCDALARVPTQPPIGSLNVSNAAAIALYEVRRQQSSKG